MAKLSEQLQEVSVSINKPTRTERKLAETKTAEQKKQYLAEREKVSKMNYSEYIEYYKTLPSWLKNVFPTPSEIEKQRKEQIEKETEKVEEKIKEYEKAKQRWEQKERLARERNLKDEYIERTEVMQNYYQELIQDFKTKARDYVSKGYTAKSVISYFKKEPYYEKQKKLGYVEEGYKIEKGELIPFKPITEKQYSPEKEARLITIESDKGRKQYIKQEGKIYPLEEPLYKELPKGTEIKSIKSKGSVEKPLFEIKTEHYEEAYPIHSKKSVWETTTGKGEFIKETPDVYISKGVYKQTKDYFGKPIYYTKTGEARFVEGKTKKEQREDIEKNIYVGGFENIPLKELKQIAPIEYAKLISGYGFGSAELNIAKEEFMKITLPSDIEKLPKRTQEELIADAERTFIKLYEGKESDVLPIRSLPLVSDIFSAISPTEKEKIEYISFFKEKGRGYKGIGEYSLLVGARTIENFGEFISSLAKPVSKVVGTYGIVGVSLLKGKGLKESFSIAKQMKEEGDINKSVMKYYEKYISPIRKGYRKRRYYELKSLYKSEDEFLRAYKSPAVSIGASALEASITLYYGTKALYGGLKGTTIYFKKYGKYGLKPSVIFRKKTPYVSKVKPMDLLKWRSENVGNIIEVERFASVDDITKGITSIEYASVPKYYSKSVSKLSLQPYYVEETWKVFNPKTSKWLSIKKPKAITSEIFSSGGYAKQIITTGRYVPEYRFGNIKWNKILEKEYKFLDITRSTLGVTKSNIYFEKSVYKNIFSEKDISKGIISTEYISTKPKGIVEFSRKIPSGRVAESYNIKAEIYKSLSSEKELKKFSNLILRKKYLPERTSYILPKQEYLNLVKPSYIKIKSPLFKGKMETYKFIGVSDVNIGYFDISQKNILFKAQKIPVELKGEILYSRFKPTKINSDFDFIKKYSEKTFSPKNIISKIQKSSKIDITKPIQKSSKLKELQKGSKSEKAISGLTTKIYSQMSHAETGITNVISKITPQIQETRATTKIINKLLPAYILAEKELFGLKNIEKNIYSSLTESEDFSLIQKQINKYIQKSASKTKTKTSSKTKMRPLSFPKIIPTVFPSLTRIDETKVNVPVGFYFRKKPIYETKSKQKKKKYAELLSYSPTLTGIIVTPKPVQIKEADVEKLLKKIQTGIEIRTPVKVI